MNYDNFSLPRINFNYVPSSTFKPREGGLYHGTSLEAATQILERDKFITANQLLKEGKLVSGEFFEEVKKGYTQEGQGIKFIPKDLVVLPEGDLKLDFFGHINGVFFSYSPKEALGYANKHDIGAVFCIDERIAKLHECVFENIRGDGIVHWGNLPLGFWFRQLMVPKEEVGNYRKIVSKNSLASVYSLETM